MKRKNEKKTVAKNSIKKATVNKPRKSVAKKPGKPKQLVIGRNHPVTGIPVTKDTRLRFPGSELPKLLTQKKHVDYTVSRGMKIIIAKILYEMSRRADDFCCQDIENLIGTRSTGEPWRDLLLGKLVDITGHYNRIRVLSMTKKARGLLKPGCSFEACETVAATVVGLDEQRKEKLR